MPNDYNIKSAVDGVTLGINGNLPAVKFLYLMLKGMMLTLKKQKYIL